VVTREGIDTVDIGAGGAGSVNLGSGKNTVTSVGWVDAIFGYSSTDIVTVGVDGAGSVNVGHGNNIVTTGAGWVGSIVGYNGIDKINLGKGGTSSISVYGGDDTVVLSMLDVIDDKVMVNGGSGFDSVSFAGFTPGLVISLASSVEVNTGKGIFILTGFENLTGGGGDDTLTGNSVANVIDGGKGNDIVRGYAGSDTLTGWAGIDNFVFNTALNATTNVDTITDFSAAADAIQIDNAIFAALTATGTLAAAAFKDLDAGAIDASDRIIYKTSTGNLYYDADGSGSAFAAVKFAVLANHAALTAADFVVV
jgi:serralysin